MIELNKIYNENCLDTMSRIEDECLGLVFFSPPYNVKVDYGEYKDNLPLEQYLLQMGAVFDGAIRVLLPGGHLVIQVGNTGRQPYIPLSDFFSTMLFNKIQMRGEIIWDKQNTTNNTAWGSWLSANKPSLRDSHEYLLVFRKDGDRAGSSTITSDEFIDSTMAIWRVLPQTKYIGHPAPFPEKLAARVINLYSFCGETVYDPFLGSGTTAVAAERLGRKWIGSEISLEYCAIAQKRIDNERAQGKLFERTQ